MINIVKFLESENIIFKGPSARGYIVISECVFCGKKDKLNVLISPDPKYSPDDDKAPRVGFTRCYSCGSGGLAEMYSVIKKIEVDQAKAICYGHKKETKSFSIDFARPDLEKSLSETTAEILSKYSSVPLPEFSRPINKDDKKAVDYILKRGLSLEDAIKINVHVIFTEDRDELWREFRKLNLSKDETEERFKIASRFLGRIIFPVEMNGSIYGYVARDYWGRPSAYKVMNSAGPLSSAFVWNYDRVKQSERLVINEGIFDAISSGIGQSVALLGKNITDTSDKIKLIQKLNPDEIVIYLDNGAYDMAQKLAQTLAKEHNNVKIVISPPVVKNEINDKVHDLLLLLDETIKKDDRGRVLIPPSSLKRLKELSKIISDESPYVWQVYKKRMALPKFKNDKKSQSIIRTWLNGKLEIIRKDFIEEIKTLNDLDYEDSGDRSAEENQRLISEASPYNPSFDLSVKF